MDCYCNNTGGRSDCPQNRRSRAYRQTAPAAGRSMPGGSYMPNRNQMNPGRSMDCGCRTESQRQSNCVCPAKRGCLTDVMRASEKMPVGMTYTPYQEFTGLYEWDTAFCQGTIFSELDKPFLMTNCPQGGARL